MADTQEFDTRAARGRLQELADSLVPIQRGLDYIESFYSDKTPVSESDEREYRIGMKSKLKVQRDAINSLMDKLP